jgi:hypothetical protein
MKIFGNNYDDNKIFIKIFVLFFMRYCDYINGYKNTIKKNIIKTLDFKKINKKFEQ